MGVRLVGRLAGIADGKVQFSGSLRNQCALADLKLARLLDTIDEWATLNGLDGEVGPSHRFEPTRVEVSPPLGMDLASGEIKTILCATGFRPTIRGSIYPFLIARGRFGTTAALSRCPASI